MTKIDIVSGFLGAGKTTLIKKLLAEAYQGEKLVLIENEFGEISIDGGFLKESGVEISEMSSGCICCSLVGDFSTALKDVKNRFHPDRILIEPSGVGKLSDVIVAVENTVHGVMDMRLNSFVTVADAGKIAVYMKNFGEFYNNQIESAGAIILSRTQKLTQEKLEAAVALLREKNPTAPIITTPWDELDGKAILAAVEKVSLADEMLAKMRDEHAADEKEHRHHHHHHDEDNEHEHHHHDEDKEHEHHHNESEEHEHHHHDGDKEHEHHHHDDGEEHEHHHHDEGDEDKKDADSAKDGKEEKDKHHHHHHHHHHSDHGDKGKKRKRRRHSSKKRKFKRFLRKLFRFDFLFRRNRDKDEEHKHRHHHHHHDGDKHEHHHHDSDEHHHHHHHGGECDDPNCSCHHHHHHADEVFTSWGAETVRRYTEEELHAILDKLDRSRYGVILRAKGIVPTVDGRWLHFDYVPDEPEVRYGAADYTGRVCVIGSLLQEDKLRELFML